jgi:RNA polymerase sigma factor FliA
MIDYPDREQYILSLAGKVKAIALYLYKKVGGTQQIAEADDFIQAGWVGAIKAVDGHDARRGTLGAYADWRIKGEILDYMRSCDFLSRDYRRDTKDSDAAPKNVSIDTIDMRTIDLEDVRSIKPYGSINARETVLKILRRSEISERSRKVLIEYYWDSATMKEIGTIHGVNESRISQIHRKALEKCKVAAV